MMEEVSIMMAYDAHITEQMNEEEILACLVAESRPKSTVPSKKPKLKESQLQQLQEPEDSIDRYQRENHQLQQASLRLEQENDNLAHRLTTGKIALKNALNEAEDKVDELTKELLHTRHRLQATEEEKRVKDEEASMLKEVFRRELEKAGQEIKRSNGIITDYKQICSQLTGRLEKQQATHRQEMDTLKSTVMSCSHCRSVLESINHSNAGQEDEWSDALSGGSGSPEPGQAGEQLSPREAQQSGEEQEQSRDEEMEAVRAQVTELEQELAQTKVQMVEAKCKIQELEHQRGILTSDLQAAKNSWLNKTLTSLRTASGSLQSMNVPREGGPVAGWAVQSAPLTGWRSKKLLWAHREGRENL